MRRASGSRYMQTGVCDTAGVNWVATDVGTGAGYIHDNDNGAVPPSKLIDHSQSVDLEDVRSKELEQMALREGGSSGSAAADEGCIEIYS